MRSDYDNWDECKKDIEEKFDRFLDAISDTMWDGKADKSIVNHIVADLPKLEIIEWIEKEIKKYDI